MREEIQKALQVGASASVPIDITTTGRSSGEPRRIEIFFYRDGDEIYLSGYPLPRPRAWLLNLAADPHFTLHLKHGVSADLPATATVISDPQERRHIFESLLQGDNGLYNLSSSQFPPQSLDTWLADSPLARVTFDDD